MPIAPWRVITEPRSGSEPILNLAEYPFSSQKATVKVEFAYPRHWNRLQRQQLSESNRVGGLLFSHKYLYVNRYRRWYQYMWKYRKISILIHALPPPQSGGFSGHKSPLTYGGKLSFKMACWCTLFLQGHLEGKAALFYVPKRRDWTIELNRFGTLVFVMGSSMWWYLEVSAMNRKKHLLVTNFLGGEPKLSIRNGFFRFVFFASKFIIYRQSRIWLKSRISEF